MSLIDAARELQKEAADYTVGNIQRNWKEMKDAKARKARNRAKVDPGIRYNSAKATSRKMDRKIARKAGLKGVLAGAALGAGTTTLVSKARSKNE
ncbi:hypothetical protein VPHD148_0019 [Vibrio phage D148]